MELTRKKYFWTLRIGAHNMQLMEDDMRELARLTASAMEQADLSAKKDGWQATFLMTDEKSEQIAGLLNDEKSERIASLLNDEMGRPSWRRIFRRLQVGESIEMPKESKRYSLVIATLNYLKRNWEGRFQVRTNKDKKTFNVTRVS